MTDSTARPQPPFVLGIVTGLAAAAVLVHVWFATLLGDMRAAYAELGGPIPGITRLVITPLWLWGVPVLGALSVAALIARRPRRVGPYVATCALLAITLALTWHFSQAPITELAGQVKAE
jgi:hypothetical protein